MHLVLEDSDYDPQELQALLREHGYKVSLRSGDIPNEADRFKAADEDLPLAFLEYFIDGIVIMDVETVAVKFANKAFADMLGYSLEEIHRHKPWDWDAVWTRREIKRMYAKRDWAGEHFETRLRCKDGRLLDVAISHKSMAWKGAQVVFCVIKDIRERKKAERFLQHAQFTLDKAIDQVFWIDMEGRFYYVNEAACVSLGYSREELLTMSVVDIDPDSTHSGLQEGWQQLQKYGALTSGRRHRDKSGRIYPVEVRANLLVFDGKEYCCAFATDISDRKQKERALHLNQFVMDNMADQALWITPDGRITYANNAACESLGYSREELVGLSLSDIDPDCPPEKILETWLSLKDEKVRRFECQHKAKDGRIYPVEVRSNYTNFDGQELRFAFITDITERKRTELVMMARMRLLQFAAEHPLDELLEAALDEAEELTGSGIGFFVFVHDDQKTLSYQNWSTRTKREYCKAEGKGEHYSLSHAGVWADCIHQRQPVIHNDYASLSHRKGLPPGHSPLVRELVVPVFRGDKIMAVVAVGNKPQAYTQQDVDTVSFLADLTWTITERKIAEEALRESESRYRSIVEHAPFGITRSTREGELLGVNPALASILKYDSVQELMETVNRSSIQEVCFPKAEERSPLVEKILTQDSWYVFNNRLRCKDGSMVTCRVHSRRIADEKGDASEFESFQENISEQLAAEEALRESEEKFRVLAETSPVAICLYQGNRQIYANPAMERLFGYSAEELCRMDFWEVAHADSQELVREQGWGRLAGQNMPGQYEFKYQTKAGEEGYVLISAGVMEYQGLPTGVASFLDITERKRTEKLLRASLGEKEVLLREIHHRVKNNLQVVSSLLFLQSQKFGDPELQDCFLESQNRVCAMALAHEQLYQSKNLAEVSIKIYLESLVQQQQLCLSPGQEIDCRLEVEDLPLDIENVVPCGLLVTELLSNAYKHAFADGRSGQVAISLRKDAENYELAVADNGVGLPKGFDYSQAKTLGLQLVTALVNQLNGTLEVESGNGTCFRVYFPG